ncbi:MAG TPA: MgtC/SapB family protein [Caulobacteraceae bacterium]|jgi:putative Mg2+ transporter-C (MgtC) family protein|nr:MgtC/SapB family protein [Caulobacteraceae bacterium]
MPLTLSWIDVAVRLGLTIVACGLLGYDRGARGHVAGIRTVVLVGLAAATAMTLGNLMLPVQGKPPTSFVQLDLMRLPLGILTGVGFIGGGAILKRGDIVSGITTAATLWLVTVIGLCFGAGHLGLGAASAAAAFLVLFPLKQVERRMTRDHRARLYIRTERGASPDVLQQVLGSKARAHLLQQAEDEPATSQRLGYELAWSRPETAGPPLDLLELINRRFEVISFEMISETPR